MVRELAITLYLLFFKLFFSLFNLFPIQKKVVFVATFGDNHYYVLDEIRKRKNTVRTVVLISKKCHYHFEDVSSTIIPYNSLNPLYVLQSIYHLATSKIVVIDNYYGFLASTSFRKDVECIQLWHAAGAIKKFGLEDPSNHFRSKRANSRFKKVYHHFHKIAVGSEGLAQIYYEAFGLKDLHILRLGIPRTDLFYDKDKIQLLRNKITASIPDIQKKSVLLYAPTYREADLQQFQLHLNIKKLYEQFSDTHILLIKLHRAIQNDSNLEEDYPGFIYDLSHYPNLNDLLVVTDCLITDYSSVPFEYSILEKPMIFFPYDLEEYRKERGFWENYEEFVPGPIAYNTEEIIDIIKLNSFDKQKIVNFRNNWNTYSDGNASYAVAQYICKKLDL
jgi:teichoic acid glycerol-phosphate primase